MLMIILRHVPWEMFKKYFELQQMGKRKRNTHERGNWRDLSITRLDPPLWP